MRHACRPGDGVKPVCAVPSLAGAGQSAQPSPRRGRRSRRLWNQGYPRRQPGEHGPGGPLQRQRRLGARWSRRPIYTITLLEDVGRVADVQAADFRGVGKLDLVVAEFGWLRTGKVIYLENQTTDWSHPRF